MNEPGSRRSLLRMAVGVLISMGALAVLIYVTDARQIRAAFRQISPRVLLLGVGLIVLSLFTRAYAWRVILRERISLWQSFLIINAGYFVNTVLPFRLGEISRAFLLMPSGLTFWEALPAVALERILDVLFALGLLFFGLPYALDLGRDVSFSYLLAGIALVGLAVTYLLVKNRGRILGWLKNNRRIRPRLRDRLVVFLESVLASMQVLTNAGRLLRVLAGMALSWGIALVFQLVLLRTFIPEAEPGWAAFVLGAVAVGVSVPSSPGNIGLYEASITLALSALGVDESLAFTYALTSHIINLAITTGFGSFGLVREGVGLKDVWMFGLEQNGGGSL